MMKISSAGNQTLYARPGRQEALRLPFLILLTFLLPIVSRTQQPAEPVDISPINGETYSIINQLSGLQMDLDHGSSLLGHPFCSRTAASRV
jgi:hypothetical protein